MPAPEVNDTSRSGLRPPASTMIFIKMVSFKYGFLLSMQYHIFCAGLPLVYLIQQVFLDLIELRGQVDINLMRVEQTLCFFPQSFFFLPAVVGNLFYGRRLIDTFSVAEDGNHHFAHCVGAAGKP